MSIPTVAWDETSPAGSQAISLGDNRIREFKTQVRQVMGVDHDFPSSGSAADNGQHLQVTLQEQADLGTGAVGATLLGSQTESGKGELFYTDEDDNDIQLTSGGYSIANMIEDGATMQTSAAPTADAGIANKLYVDSSAVKTIMWVIPNAVETGTEQSGRAYIDVPGIITKARAYAKTAPTDASLLFDININGTTIWTTQGDRVAIASGANAGSETSFDVTALAVDDYVTCDIDQVGSTVAGSDITVLLTYTPNVT